MEIGHRELWSVLKSQWYIFVMIFLIGFLLSRQAEINKELEGISSRFSEIIQEYHQLTCFISHQDTVVLQNGNYMYYQERAGGWVSGSRKPTTEDIWDCE